jgi:ubiquitin carboxyl-terminal hydrolase 8
METDSDDNEIIYGISKYNNKSGVICYMNSILAVLQQTPIFTDYILTAQFKDKLLEKHPDKKTLTDSILFQLYNLLNISHSYDNYNINPDAFRKAITKKDEMWGENQHQDSQEFLTFLLNSVEEEIAEKVEYIPGRNINNISRIISVEQNLINIMATNCWQKYLKNEYSIIKNLFGGTTHVSITCSYCGNKSHNFDIFQVLQLSISNDNKSLEDCLNDYIKEEKMDKDNMIKCNFCGRCNKSTKQTMIWNAPKILIIQLKRFRVNNYGVITEKISNMIDYPITNLDISKYMNNNAMHINIHNNTYNLYAVNNHHSIGPFNSINFGHYTTNVINRYDNKWYKFDDSKSLVEITDEKKLISKNAYMLFYYRNDS